MLKNCFKEKELNKYLYERMRGLSGSNPCKSCDYWVKCLDKCYYTYRDKIISKVSTHEIDFEDYKKLSNQIDGMVNLINGLDEFEDKLDNLLSLNKEDKNDQ